MSSNNKRKNNTQNIEAEVKEETVIEETAAEEVVENKPRAFKAEVVNCEKLRIRKAPNGDELAIVPAGTRLTVVAKDSEWSTITFKGQEAFVMTKFIKFM